MNIKEIKERFFSNIKKQNDCLIWQGDIKSDGNGRFYHDYERQNINIIAWQIYYSEKPKGRIIKFCNKKLCIAKNHMGVNTNINDLERAFWSKVKKGSNDDCWEWIGNGDINKYGTFYCFGANTQAHRFSYRITNGNFLKELCVLHKCDNPSCVNPNHLFLGSHNDNVQDKVEKNRQAKGSKNGRSKLNENKVKQILETSDSSNKLLAKKFNVSSDTIRLIKKRKIWKHV